MASRTTYIQSCQHTAPYTACTPENILHYVNRAETVVSVSYMSSDAVSTHRSWACSRTFAAYSRLQRGGVLNLALNLRPVMFCLVKC